MSKLASLGVPYTTVGTANGAIPVRGLSFSDLSYIAATYAPALVEIFKAAPKPAEGQIVADFLDQDDVKDFLLGGQVIDVATRVAPRLVAEIIACGADGRGDPDSIDAADRLPFGLQIELFSAILKATLSEGGLGKLKEIVGAALKSPTPEAPKA